MALAEEMFRITPLDLESQKDIFSHHFPPRLEKHLLTTSRFCWKFEEKPKVG